MHDEHSILLSPEQLRHTDSMKWTRYPADVLPLWVADMDFAIAPSIKKALVERLDHGIGYHNMGSDVELTRLLRIKLEAQGFAGLPEKGWLGFLSGVVPGIYAAVMALTAPGDDVLTMTPIYPPFLSAITNHGRRSRLVPLVDSGSEWTIDFDALERSVTPATRLMLLCHPHNPTGRVWTRDELTKIADIAQRHRLWFVSDELHADLTLDKPFIPFTCVASPELQQRLITLTGPCKAYNTAGLGIGAMVSHNVDLITRLKKTLSGIGGHAGAMSHTMWRTALEDNGEWLATVLGVLRRNRDTLTKFVAEKLPGVKMVPPQATYLAWLDYRAHPRPGDIQQYLLTEGKVALNPGPHFGVGFDGFVRLNFATSPQILVDALARMQRVHQMEAK